MAVRLRVRLRARKGAASDFKAETAAIANTGFEAEGVEVVIPHGLARRMGFLPELPQGTRVESYISASGPTHVHVIPQALEIEVLAEGRSQGPVVADAVVVDTDEVLLSDRLIETLDVVLEKPGSGLWRFSDEPPSELRKSEPPERW